LTWKLQALGNPGKISQRVRLHFLHDVTTMKLDCFLSDAHLCGDLFIEHSRNDTPHHFAFTRREQFIAPTFIRQPGPQLARNAIATNRLSDGVEQVLRAERLRVVLVSAAWEGRSSSGGLRPSIEEDW
jgi:hypothetical protein